MQNNFRKNKIEIIKKIITIFICFFAIVVVNFFLPRLMPGDQVLMLTGIEQEGLGDGAYEKYYHELGLDRSMFEQFISYISGIFSGDLGYSYHAKMQVTDVLSKGIWVTLQLALPVFIISSVIAFILGLECGYRKGSKVDNGVVFSNILMSSFPGFLIAMLLLVVFSFKMRLFPLGGLNSTYYSGSFFVNRLWHLILPTIAMVIATIPQKFLLVRNAVSCEMSKEYVAYARSRGLSHYLVLYVNIGRNVLLTYLATLSLSFGFILSGSMIVENVFSINGMGSIMYDAVINRDFPLIQGGLLISAVTILASSLIFEIASLFMIGGEQ